MRSSSEESECAICLENKTGKIAVLSCGHTYHYKCIEDWVNQKKNTMRCCCICEKYTEIINIIGEDEPNEVFVDNSLTENTNNDNTMVDNTIVDSSILNTNNHNSTNMINNSESFYYYDDSYFPNYSVRSNIYRNTIFATNRVAPEQDVEYVEERDISPGFFDVLCCNIL